MNVDPIIQIVNKILYTRLFTITQTDITLFLLIIFFLLFISVIVFSRLIARKAVLKILSRSHIDEGLQYTFQRITEYTLIIIG
ncbi:MAG: hypothetical protein JXM72_10540, partial [Deltaproteobacteria bacterium]|nr:hypothetical protein [Deltaproteobacteria bacterium]